MENNSIFFSIIIPAHNEESVIASTCEAIINRFKSEGINDFEIVCINDNSKDNTEQVLQKLCAQYPVIRYFNSVSAPGFGLAVRRGLVEYKGEVAAIVMGDLSDSPDDILSYYSQMKQGAECVFGSRFIKGSNVINYPNPKYTLNRLGNLMIKLLFRFGYNDITNAFKCYHRKVIDGIQPLLSRHFNLTVEIPLKAIVRGYNYKVIPISWTNRRVGKSKFHIKEMGSRYLFIILYVFLEKLLSGNDYKRVN
ncbi:MAG: glycosyltransferase family 2 protein [Candidatus Omnitrophica bacterium]|nr:glycosyltransferase family 2 protein [Candidatus Omnitrophota bacterium]